MKGKAADCHMSVRMIREIKVPRDRFRCESFRATCTCTVNFVIAVVVYYVDGGIRCCTSTFPGIQAFLRRFFQQFLVSPSFIIVTSTMLILVGGPVAEY